MTYLNHVWEDTVIQNRWYEAASDESLRTAVQGGSRNRPQPSFTASPGDTPLSRHALSQYPMLVTPMFAEADPVGRSATAILYPVSLDAWSEHGSFLSDVDRDDGTGSLVQARLTLLARKYVRKSLSTEEQARLQILSERLRAVLPRVSEADVAQLEVLRADLQAAREANDAVRRKLREHTSK